MPKQLKIVTEATTGLKMEESAARRLGEAMKTAPREARYRRIALPSAEFNLEEKSRTDVSMITSDAVDRDREVVIPSGMDAAGYNGVVTFAHMYDALPVGRCLWIKPKGNGLLAKTQYAPKPEGWKDDWFPDAILSLMGMDPPACTGKSIGFISQSWHEPTVEEIKARPELAEAWRIIDRWTLIEYAVAPVPCNPEAEMVSVAKSLKVSDATIKLIADAAKLLSGPAGGGGDDEPPAPDAPPDPEPQVKIDSFVTPGEFAAAVARRVAAAAPDVRREVAERVREEFLALIGRP